MASVRARLMGLLLSGALVAPSAFGQQTGGPSRSSDSFVVQTGGLFGRFSSGGNTQEKTAPPKAPQSVKPAGGILGRIFGSGGENPTSSVKSSSDKDDDGRRVIEPVPHSDTPDWSGVPFHKATPLTARSGTRPLSDPNDPSNQAAGTLRDAIHSSSSLQAGSGAASANSRATTNSRVPVPPSEKSVATRTRTAVASQSTGDQVATGEGGKPMLQTSTYRPPSSTESNRRSRRKAVDPLEIALDRTPASVSSRGGDRDGTSSQESAQPRVARRTIPSNVPAMPSDNPVGASEEVAGPEVAGPVPTSREPELTPPPSPAWGPARSEAVAASPEAVEAPATSPSQTQGLVTNPTATNPTAIEPPSVDTPATRLAAPEVASSAESPVTTVTVPRVASTPISSPDNVAATTAATVEPTQSPPATAGTIESPASSASVAAIPSLEGSVSEERAAAESLGTDPSRTGNLATGSPPAGTPSTAGASTMVGERPQSLVAPQAVANQSVPVAVNTPTAPVSTTAAPAAPAATSSAANGGASGSVNLTSDLPGLRVTTTGPSDVTIRQPITYVISVENRGVIDAPGAAIQVKLPRWVELLNVMPSRGEIVRQNDPEEQQLLWVVEGLQRAGQEKLQLELVANESREFAVDVEWAVVPQSSIARIAVREPKLELVIEGPESVVYGQSANYQVRVFNPGTGTAENVVFTLSPNSATPQSQKIGRILPGGETRFEVELTARDLESLQIHGLATGDLEMRVEEVKTIQVTSAKLYATLSGPALKYQDSVGNFKIELENQGNADATNVVAMLDLPEGVIYQGGIDGAQQAGQQLQWTISELGVGEKVEYPLQCLMQTTGLHTLAFACKGTAASNASVQFQTQVDALADLVLTTNDPQAPAPTQQEVTYEIVIRNRGSKAATDVITLAQFGFDIEPLRVEGGEATLEPGQVLFNPIKSIEPGQTVTLRVIARAEKPGLHRFRSEVKCSDTLLIAEEATRYLEAVGQRVSRSSTDSEPR